MQKSSILRKKAVNFLLIILVMTISINLNVSANLIDDKEYKRTFLDVSEPVIIKSNFDKNSIYETNLTIEVWGGFGVNIRLWNKGNFIIYNVSLYIKITAGVFNPINYSNTLKWGKMVGGEAHYYHQFLAGWLMPIQVEIFASESESEPLVNHTNGFVFLCYVFLPNMRQPTI